MGLLFVGRHVRLRDRVVLNIGDDAIGHLLRRHVLAVVPRKIAIRVQQVPGREAAAAESVGLPQKRLVVSLT